MLLYVLLSTREIFGVKYFKEKAIYKLLLFMSNSLLSTKHDISSQFCQVNINYSPYDFVLLSTGSSKVVTRIILGVV